jgi:hypothetical protein
MIDDSGAARSVRAIIKGRIANEGEVHRKIVIMIFLRQEVARPVFRTTDAYFDVLA